VNDASTCEVLSRSLSADTGKQIDHPLDKVAELLLSCRAVFPEQRINRIVVLAVLH
jgi:hypothetical protein